MSAESREAPPRSGGPRQIPGTLLHTLLVPRQNFEKHCTHFGSPPGFRKFNIHTSGSPPGFRKFTTQTFVNRWIFGNLLHILPVPRRGFGNLLHMYVLLTARFLKVYYGDFCATPDFFESLLRRFFVRAGFWKAYRLFHKSNFIVLVKSQNWEYFGIITCFARNISFSKRFSPILRGPR